MNHPFTSLYAFSVVKSRPIESPGGIIHRGKAVDCDLVVKPMGKTFFQTRPDQYLHITWKDESIVVSTSASSFFVRL